jgi:hypothetical protein
LLLPILIGCAKRAPGSTVSGTVTYDGESIPYGTVGFVPYDDVNKVPLRDAEHPAAYGEIKNGKYSVQSVIPGKKVLFFISRARDNYEGRDNIFYDIGTGNEKIDIALKSPTKK